MLTFSLESCFHHIGRHKVKIKVTCLTSFSLKVHRNIRCVWEEIFYFLHIVECVTLISGQQESISIDRFMRETGERWKNVSMELRCVQSMLEEVVAYWRRWNTLADEFESWLDRAYGLLDLPEEDKMEYFQVICQYSKVNAKNKFQF